MDTCQVETCNSPATLAAGVCRQHWDKVYAGSLSWEEARRIRKHGTPGMSSEEVIRQLQQEADAAANAKYDLKNSPQQATLSRLAPHKDDPFTWRKQTVLTYGITIDEWESMYAEQKGKCPICRDSFDILNLHVDHCHICGKGVSKSVRGLLCPSCNTSPRLDYPAMVKRALAYSHKHYDKYHR